MSYLDGPRIYFAGKFQASPATINNTPNNYNPENYNQNTLKPEKIELYWEPSGNSVFNLAECTVTGAASGTPGDSLIGAQVSAVYTGSWPKLVDLDPMQQNGSEIWGFTLMLGDFTGAYVQGAFTPIAFNAIWMNSQGDNTPHSSASGAAAYLSTLTDLKWNVGDSVVLQKLQAISPKRLSIRMVVSAHNDAPYIYAFTDATFGVMASRGVPKAVQDKLQPLTRYFMNFKDGVPDMPGYLPTIEYTNYLLAQVLDPATINQYGATILSSTLQKYEPWGPGPVQPLYGFNYGKIIAAVGPSLDGEPRFVVPVRSLAPVPAPVRELAPPPPLPTPAAWWALAKLDLTATPPSLTLDLANSLPVEMPGRPLWSETLGTLSLAYVTGTGASKTYTTIVPSIDYTSPDFLDKQSGLLVVTNFGSVDPKTLATRPLAVMSTVTQNGAPVTKPFLEECGEGWSVRADQFIYRMNPGMTTTGSFAQGETNTVDVYVRKFGEIAGTAGTSIAFSTMTADQAAYYTVRTLGTGGTNGITEKNLSTPPNKLAYSATSVPVQDGKASVTIRASDPGNPRVYVDGQVYFGMYNLTPAVPDLYTDPNDILSVQIYQQNPINGYPTWMNGIGNILRQYGMLYPIMGQFQLWTYQGVAENRDKIQGVLGLDVSLPMHMPVTRDLSAIKCKLLMDWFAAGMPYEQLGPAGSGGTGWNDLPTVGGWGPLTGLVIRSGDIIDAITPIYGTQTGPTNGGPGGSPTQVSFAGDPIVAMSGSTGTYFGHTHVAQLTFTTAAGKTLGPYGSLRNVSAPQPFHLTVAAGFHINSFFGATFTHSDRKTFVSALGGNVLPV